MGSTQTALIVAVPEVEDVVGPFRRSLDRAASWGVPAHVTVLYPFLAPEHVNDDVGAAVGGVVAAVPRFDVTAAVHQRFSETPPYAGAFADIVPHLMIGHDAPKHVLAQVGEAVAASLPIRASTTAPRALIDKPAARRSCYRRRSTAMTETSSASTTGVFREPPAAAKAVSGRGVKTLPSCGEERPAGIRRHAK